ncbi:MAG: ABC transporter ATP-binding protein [Ferruginibacter sp.]
MNDLVIKVENISKAYRIGLKEQRHDTLGATMTAWVKSPFKNFKKLKSLSNFKNEEDEDIFWALKDINFEVKRGEVLGIVGRNGAGKSTLLKILSRVTEPTTGRIEIYGRVASLLEVGTGFNPELSGRENVYLNGTILGMTKKEIDTRFDEIIEFSGVEKFIDTPVKRYSSGMKVRLAFAVAAHLDSEILIIDEVLAVGDADFQKKCLGKMEELTGKEQRTILFVSHNMAAVRSFCSKSIVLETGRLKFSGSITEGIAHYSSKDNQLTGNDVFYDINLNDGNDVITNKPFTVSFKCKKLQKGQKGYVFLIIKDSDSQGILHTRARLEKLNKSENDLIEIEVQALNIRAGLYSYHLKIILEDVDNRNSKFLSDDQVLDMVNLNNNDMADSLGIVIPETSWN